MSIGSKKIAIAITLITLICKMLGFLKNSVLAYYFGTSAVVDAYVMCFSIGTITSGWIAGLIGNFTPKYKEIEIHKGHDKTLVFSSRVMNMILTLVLLLIGLLELMAPVIVRLAAPGFDDLAYSYTVHFFRMYCISIFFYAIFRFSQEYLNCNQKHLTAIIPDMLMSSICVVGIIISSKIGADFLILGYIVAILLQSIITYLCSQKMGFKMRVVKPWDDDVKSLLVMAVPIFLSDTLSNINNFIDKIFASNLGSGIVSALDYANTMKEFAYQAGTIAITTMIFPVLSKLWANGNKTEFESKLVQGLNYFTFIYIPVIYGIVFTGDIIISVVFQRGEFTGEATIITTNAFIIYSISLIAMVYRCVFLKAFYAMQKTIYILIVSFSNVVLNIILNVILVRRFGYLGLTAATTLAALICIPLYFLLFKKAVNDVNYKEFGIKLLKCFLAATVMGGITYFLRLALNQLFTNGIALQLLLLGIIAIIGIGTYSLFCILFKVEEISNLLLILRSRNNTIK